MKKIPLLFREHKKFQRVPDGRRRIVFVDNSRVHNQTRELRDAHDEARIDLHYLLPSYTHPSSLPTILSSKSSSKSVPHDGKSTN